MTSRPLRAAGAAGAEQGLVVPGAPPGIPPGSGGTIERHTAAELATASAVLGAVTVLGLLAALTYLVRRAVQARGGWRATVAYAWTLRRQAARAGGVGAAAAALVAALAAAWASRAAVAVALLVAERQVRATLAGSNVAYVTAVLVLLGLLAGATRRLATRAWL